MQSGVPSTLRVMNKSLVLNIIRQDGPISRAQIAKKTSLTRATVSEIVNDLLQEKVIFEGGTDESPIGRKGILLNYNASLGYGIGIDLGGTKISLGIFDLNGELLNKQTASTFQVEKGDEFVELLVNMIDKFIIENSKSRSTLHFIGVASPGIIDYKQGVVVEGSPNLPNLENLDLSKQIEKIFGVPVVMENDVRAALIGEIWKGKCQNVQSALLISLGTGIGSALLMDGKIIRGAGNAAGEIGYMLFDREHLYHDWKNKGCFETLASGSGLTNKISQYLDQPYTKKWATAENIFQDAKTGDSYAKEIINEMVDYLSIAILNLIASVNPETIVLTGGLSRSADYFLEKLKKNVQRHTITRNRAKIVVSELFDSAALYGISILSLSTIKPSIQFIQDVKIR